MNLRFDPVLAAQLESRSDAISLRKRLQHGSQLKAVFVRDNEIEIFRADTARAQAWMNRHDWSLAGVYQPAVDVDQVLEDINVTRREQRELRRAMRNFDVRA